MGQSDQNIARAFRDKATRKGLAFSHSRPPKRHSFLDINAGTIIAPRDPREMLRLVRLAARYDEAYVLLSLVARRDRIDESAIYWDRYSFRSEGYVTLKEWLEENDHPYEPRLVTFMRSVRRFFGRGFRDYVRISRLSVLQVDSAARLTAR
ncbi:MAG: hypothetical protein KBD06_03545 [Candidatus Pacebacteria bacterium]|nr:hypothetical protein [Candidatus Paceibacterota bacterium]